MKLIFKKDEESQISVLQKASDGEKAFSYVEMIKSLIISKQMQDPDIMGNFTADEVVSIKRMVKLINENISSKDEDEPVS